MKKGVKKIDYAKRERNLIKKQDKINQHLEKMNYIRNIVLEKMEKVDERTIFQEIEIIMVIDSQLLSSGKNIISNDIHLTYHGFYSQLLTTQSYFTILLLNIISDEKKRKVALRKKKIKSILES